MSVDVYHQLHCLQYIRQVLHRDHYTFPAAKVDPVAHAGALSLPCPHPVTIGLSLLHTGTNIP